MDTLDFEPMKKTKAIIVQLELVLDGKKQIVKQGEKKRSYQTHHIHS
jgi:hypothetical protein